MHFTFIEELFSGHAATAICWTLIHSLWEGLFFSLATGLALLGTKNSYPSLRYRILSIQFLLFILVILVTFIWEWNNGNPAHTFQNHATGNILPSATGD